MATTQDANSPSHKASEEQNRFDKLLKWLKGLDNGKGAMIRFFDPLVSEFDGDLMQIAAAMKDSGEKSRCSLVETVDPMFWDVLGVETIGQKMLLARGIAKLCMQCKQS